ncbi:mechanosensitive ion channel domain-containing protein [Nitrospira sp. Nam80]
MRYPFVMLSAVLLGLLCTSPSLAGAAPLSADPSSGEPAAQPDQPAASGNLSADLQAKRAQAATELAQIDKPSTLRKGAPPGVSESELLERRSLLQQLVQTYDRHLDEIGKLAQAQQRVRDVERQSKEWDGFPESPPYSVLMVDDLRNAFRSMTFTAQGIETRLSMTERLIETTGRTLSKSQEQARQAAERLEGVRDPVQLEQLTWTRELADLRTRAAAAQASMLDTSRKVLHEELTEADRRRAFLDRQRQTAEQDVQFTQQDLDKITARLDEEHKALASEIEQAVLQQSVQRRAVSAAEHEVTSAHRAVSESKKKAARPGEGRLARLTETLELQRLRYDNINLNLDLLRQLLDSVRQERRIWEMRFASLHGTVPITEERDAVSKLTAAAKLIQGWREYCFQQLAMVAGQINELTGRMEEQRPRSSPKHLQDMIGVLRHREDMYRRVLQQTDTILQLIDHREAEFKQRRHARPLSERLREWGTSAAASVNNAWNIELFSAEDTIEVEGKTITGRRSITVGKVLKALAILLGGYWISIILARFAERKAITKFHIDPNVANIIRQWALAFLFTILVIITLMSVKIPLTAFAFLGGALAIGVGFGTQNLLKNVISGILLLVERPLRVGDVIEVDGIRGTVTTIGLRSSTIRDSTGVETLIPNSNLLERNLTNWTYSSYRKRYSLQLTVVEGPASRRVKDLLVDLALRHGRILKEPEPYVLLEEFKDGALVFSLQYWIEIGPAVDPATVASDLRFMIESAFADQGIARK